MIPTPLLLTGQFHSRLIRCNLTTARTPLMIIDYIVVDPTIPYLFGGRTYWTENSNTVDHWPKRKILIVVTRCCCWPIIWWHWLLLLCGHYTQVSCYWRCWLFILTPTLVWLFLVDPTDGRRGFPDGGVATMTLSPVVVVVVVIIEPYFGPDRLSLTPACPSYYRYYGDCWLPVTFGRWPQNIIHPGITFYPGCIVIYLFIVGGGYCVPHTIYSLPSIPGWYYWYC